MAGRVAEDTAAKGKDFVFNALWAAVGETEFTSVQGYRHKPVRCQIKVPLTFVFKDGEPWRAVAMDRANQFIVRVPLESPSLYENARSDVTNKGMTHYRNMLLEFSRTNRYGDCQANPADPFLCTVTFVDGEQEDMTLQRLDLLMHNDGWRNQVLLIQGYVPAVDRKVGNYELARTKLEEDEAAAKRSAADNIARTIAQVVEKAYASTKTLSTATQFGSRSKSLSTGSGDQGSTREGTIGGGSEGMSESKRGDGSVDSFRTQVGHPADPPSSSGGGAGGAGGGGGDGSLQYVETHGIVDFKVKNLRAVVAETPRGDKVMLFSDYVLASVGRGRRVMEQQILSEQHARESLAAETVTRDLKELLLHADKRGINATESFGHFDVANKGVVDVDGLIAGLAKLGIGVTFPVAELVMQNVGGTGSVFFTARDLTTFMEHVGDDGGGYAPDSLTLSKVSSTSTRNRRSRKESRSQQDAKRKTMAGSANDVNVPTKSFSLVDTQFEPAPPEPDFLLPKRRLGMGSRSSSRGTRPPSSSGHDGQTGRGLGASSPGRQDTPGPPSPQRLGTASPILKSRESPSPGLSAPASRVGPRVAWADRPQSRPSAKATGLMSIANEAGALAEADEVLHLEHGFIMTFRVVEVKPVGKEKSKRGEKRRELMARQRLHAGAPGSPMSPGAATAAAAIAGGGPGTSPLATQKRRRGEAVQIPPDGSRFTLVVVPDLFMTLEALETHLEELLEKFLFARIVVIGLPGLPNTIWPAQWVLNPDLHARSIAKLLQHLHSTGRISSPTSLEECEPVLLMGFGTGGHSLTRFVHDSLPGMPWLMPRVRAIILVNTVLKYSPSFKRKCKELLRTLVTMDGAEVRALVASLHFWDDYLDRHGRDACLDEYWSLRDGLCNEDADGRGAGFVGVIAQLKAILGLGKEDFDGAMLLTTPLPVVVVQSTENVFVNPRHASVYQPDQLPPERYLVSSVADSLLPGAVHVSWLRAGHEVLQERTNFIVGIVANLAQIAGARPSGEVAALPVFAPVSLTGDEDTNISGDTDSQMRQLLGEMGDATISLAGSMSHGSGSSISRSLNGGVENLDLPLGQASMTEVPPDEVPLTLLEEERAKLELKLKTQAAMDKRRQLAEQAMEEGNRVLMADEDNRTRRVEAFLRRLEAERQRAERRRHEREEAARLKREEALAELEHDVRAQKIQRSVDRRVKTKEYKATIRANETFLGLHGTGEVTDAFQGAGSPSAGSGGDKELFLMAMGKDHEPDMVLMIDTYSSLKVFLEERQRTVDVRKRIAGLKVKTLVVQRVRDQADKDMHRTERAYGLVSQNPGLVQNGVNADAEIARLQATMQKNKEVHTELSNLYHDKLVEMKAARGVMADREAGLEKMYNDLVTNVSHMSTAEALALQTVTTLRAQIEKLTEDRVHLQGQVSIQQRRLAKYSKEEKRLLSCPDVFVDTDVWTPGYMQRLKRTTLLNNMTKERQNAETALQKLTNDIEANFNRCKELSYIMKRERNAAERLSAGSKAFKAVLYKMNISAEALDATVDTLTEAQATAKVVERRRTKEFDYNRAAAELGAENPAERLRMKAHELRTPEEKRYVALDLVVNPEAFYHLSPDEIEQMRFDKDYHTDLSRSDIERIFRLPALISLAMPFLFTTAEVEAHRLFNKYWRDQEEDYFIRKDAKSVAPRTKPVSKSIISNIGNRTLTFASFSSGLTLTGSEAGGGPAPHHAPPQDGNDNDDDDTSSATKMTAAERETRDQEARHEVLLREARRDNVRSLSFFPHEVEGLPSDEDLAWFQVERILNPYLFPASVRPKAGKDPLLTLRSSGKEEESVSANLTLGSAFDYTGWRCPYSAAQLEKMIDEIDREYDGDRRLFARSMSILVARKLSQPDMVEMSDRNKARRLLKRYYVSMDESEAGHERLSALADVSSGLAELLRRTLERDREEDKQREKDRERAEKREHHRNLTDKERERLRRRRRKQASSRRGRFWGSWEQVHPASMGRTSQKTLFTAASFSSRRDHPASYAVRRKQQHVPGRPLSISGGSTSAGSDDMDSEDDANAMLLDAPSNGMEALLSAPTAAPRLARNHEHKYLDHDQWLVLPNLTALSKLSQAEVEGNIVLVENQDSMVLFDHVTSGDLNQLSPRQSRTHHFDIPDRGIKYVLDVTVSIIYQGTFTKDGYRPGRIAVSLFRLTGTGEVGSESGVPQPVGYAPYNMQTPNLPDAIGRMVICHRPDVKPLLPGRFRVVVGAAAETRYSIEVSCRYATLALPIVDHEVEEAKKNQLKIAQVLKQIKNVQETIRLGERKVEVCRKLVFEAQAEGQRTRVASAVLIQELRHDDVVGLLEDKVRMDKEAELQRIDVETAEWMDLFITRSREFEDIERGLGRLKQLLFDLNEEKAKLVLALDKARSELPACVAVLRSMAEATAVATQLNAPVPTNTEDADEVDADDDPFDEGDEEAARKKQVALAASVLSPAEEVRRRMKRDGFKQLTLVEQQWCLLDQSLNPSKYEWLREQEEAERLKAIERQRFLAMSGKTSDADAAIEKDPFGMNSPLLAAFRLTQVEIQHVLRCPYIMLTKREIGFRKLLARFHDDTELARRSATSGMAGFDSHLAERTRGKHPATWTKEEAEWVSIDRILNPEVWKFFGSKDPESVFAAKKRAKEIELRNKRVHTTEQPTAAARSKQARQKDVISRLVGMEKSQADDFVDEIGGTAENFDLKKFVSTAHKKAGESAAFWTCKMTKDEILRLWATPRRLLKTDEEKHAFKLLLKYNGTYRAFMEAQESWTATLSSQRHGIIDYGAYGVGDMYDLDRRARRVLRELDRVKVNKNAIVTSNAIHLIDQRFPREELIPQLEQELDRLLAEQITTGEMARKRRIDSSDSEGGDVGSRDSGGQSDEVELEEEGVDGDGARMKKAMLKRAKRKTRREQRRKVREEYEKRMAKLMKRKKQTSGAAMAEAMLELELGQGGCIACRSNPCQWRPSADIEACTARVQEVEAEAKRIRNINDKAVVESTVCLMAQLGGESVFSKTEVLWDLESERNNLKNEMDLNNVDKELHDAYATRKEFIEVKHLHGYGVMLWTNNARSALQARQARLIATTVVKEVVDDILDYMLEGWYFGERESAFTMIGYVPSIKPGGRDTRIRAGQDQIRLIGPAMEKIRARAEAKKKGIMLDEFRRGDNAEKAAGIELSAQFALERQNIEKDFKDNAHLLNETETTLKIGLFMMTLMYFRVMALLRREKNSWNGDDELGGKGGKGGKGSTTTTTTRERLRMMEEERNTKARLARLEAAMIKYRIGAKARLDREEAVRKAAIRARQAAAKQRKKEDNAIRLLQRFYRGYRGRVNVRHWAVKRAEWDAMRVVMTEAALNIQRVYRGHLGRTYYNILRTEIAQFIAIVRYQEAEADEEEYWREHPWSRFKRDQIAWLQKESSIYKMLAARNAVDYGAPAPEFADDKDLRARLEMQKRENDEIIPDLFDTDDLLRDDKPADDDADGAEGHETNDELAAKMAESKRKMRQAEKEAAKAAEAKKAAKEAADRARAERNAANYKAAMAAADRVRKELMYYLGFKEDKDKKKKRARSPQKK